MSGGSFDYLCFKDVEFPDALGAMAAELDALGPSHAAADTRALIAALADCQARVDRLRDVWKAVEWWRSGDRSKQCVVEALAEYESASPRPTRATDAGASCEEHCTAREAGAR